MTEEDEAMHFVWPDGISPPVWYANNQWAVTNKGCIPLVPGISAYPVERMWRGQDGTLANVSGPCAHHLVDVDEFLDACNQAVQIHRMKGRTLVDWDLTRRTCLNHKARGVAWKELWDFLEMGPESSHEDILAALDLFSQRFPAIQSPHPMSKERKDEVAVADMHGRRFIYLGERPEVSELWRDLFWKKELKDIV